MARAGTSKALDAAFKSLLGDGLVTVDDILKGNAAPKKKAKPKVVKVGCEHCPLNEAGCNKVKGLKDLKGRRILIWGEAPGPTENERKKNLQGRAAQWFWQEVRNAGISRKDCDTQNVVRCWPRDKKGKTRPPSKEEVQACSIFNDKAIAAVKRSVKVHIVLGEVAARALLGKEYKKDAPYMWSEKLNAKVIVLDHPSYFIRGFAGPVRLRLFRDRLAMVHSALEHPGRFDFVKAQNYKLVCQPDEVRRALKRLKSLSVKKGYRVTVDIETGWVKHGRPSTEKGAKQVVLCIGFCYKPGHAVVVALDHPDNKASKQERRRVKRLLLKFLQSKSVRKSLHHGTSDSRELRRLMECSSIEGYDFDTEYACYLRWPQQRAYGIDALTKDKLLEFSGYKDVIKPFIAEAPVNYAKIPLRIMRWYNGGDCDVTKRLELLTEKHIDMRLLKTYISVAFTLDNMESRGPFFDKKYYDEVAYLVPEKRDRVYKKLQKIASSHGFKGINLNSNPQLIELMYKSKKGLRLPVIDVSGGKGKKKKSPYSTGEATLKLVHAETNHPFPQLLMEYRSLNKMDTTYLSNYQRSAERYGGQLRTSWWLTGAVTGRLRSGGKEKEDIVNFQNLHGDPMLQNLLVSDLDWRTVLKASKYVKKGLKIPKELLSAILALVAFVGYDYSGIEIRVLAEMSGDPLLIEQFNSGIDIHCMVGNTLTGLPWQTIKENKAIRTAIKQMHFGIVYGKNKATLKEDLIRMKDEGKVTQDVVDKSDFFYDEYFRKYRGVAKFIDNMRDFADRHGYVPTLFGFKRPIDKHGEDGRQSFWGNQAVNSPIQGTAHQLLLFAMALLADHPERYPKLSSPVMEVHDALVFNSQVRDIPEAFKEGAKLLQEDVVTYIKEVFNYKMKVPLVCEAKIGFRLGVMNEYKEPPKVLTFISDWLNENKKVDAKIEEEWGIAA